MKHSKARRTSIIVAMLLVMIAVVGCGTSSEPADSSGSSDGAGVRELYVASYGGKFDEALQSHVAEFEQEHNAKVVFLPGTTSDALLKARNKEVDVIFNDPIFSFRGENENLWEPLTEDTVPNLKDLYQIARMSEYTVAHDMGAYGITYNTKLVEEPPTSWLDMWKPEYAGKITLRSFRPDSIELLVLMARLNGGDERNIDPGFEKLAELSPNVHTWYSQHPQALDLFRNEEVTLGLWTDARTNWAKEEGADVEVAIPEEGAFALISTLNVVAGRPNTDLALAYVNFELSKLAQLDVATGMGYFPVNKTVEIPADVQEKLAFTPDNIENAQIADWNYIVTVMDDWKERWEKEVLGAN